MASFRTCSSAGAPAGAASADRQAPAVHHEPVGFLLAVMNDDSVETGLRIEAAKALLPYFRKALD